ncbi:MAG: acyltransferase [Parvibaculum sp.]|uniref:acyltransferase family protein n=1 Tax=Parvibaculum sp. TaxID=2024848 RepID=UPI0025EB9D4C|nr:acyltransferase [Parvibaculum sp.]MCE9648850.1 acyltransferase [Parvibaculum sp.]
MAASYSTFFSGQTVDERLIETKGRTSGFDVLRISLAVAVLGWHSVVTTYGSSFEREVWNGPFRGLVCLILPTFFALSGFLVAGSLFRTKSLLEFAALRGIRIFPALVVEITISALILGSLLTSFDLATYFSDGKFWIYLLNVVGWIHYQLPGLFLTNPKPEFVNLSLWTVPYELECYVGLIVLACLSLIRRPKAFLAFVIALNLLLPVFDYYTGSGFSRINRPPGRLLVICFLAGVSFYLLRDRIRLNAGFFVAALIVSLFLVGRRDTIYLAPFPVAYVTVYFGLLELPRIPVLMRGDYSYGIYLYAFPMQQTFAFLFPAHLHWWLNIAFALTMSLLCAMFSWAFIEKPILLRKRTIVAQIERTVALCLRMVVGRAVPPPA